MKNTQSILDNIVRIPQFSSLAQHSCYEKFMAQLPPRYKKAIAFIYIKDDTLFLALSHPGYKMELNYNKDLFKDLLANVQKYVPECNSYGASNIVVFNSKYHTPKVLKSEPTIPYYSELSSGDFTLDIDDEELLKKFERTKELIRERLSV